jgi:hypothetical protein
MLVGIEYREYPFCCCELTLNGVPTYFKHTFHELYYGQNIIPGLEPCPLVYCSLSGSVYCISHFPGAILLQLNCTQVFKLFINKNRFRCKRYAYIPLLLSTELPCQQNPLTRQPATSRHFTRLKC